MTRGTYALPELVRATISAENQWTDWIQVNGKGKNSLALIITNLSGWTGTITLQSNRAGDADALAIDDPMTFSGAARENVEMVGPGLLRIGCKTGDFSAGSLTVELHV